MDEAQGLPTMLDAERIGDARAAITTLAWTNGITDKREAIDDFVDGAANLADAAVDFDHFERLLITLARRGIVSDQQRFALHAAYILQKSSGV